MRHFKAEGFYFFLLILCNSDLIYNSDLGVGLFIIYFKASVSQSSSHVLKLKKFF